MKITPKELAGYFDHTQLKAYAVRADFEKLCRESREYAFRMVAINPAPVALCRELLSGSNVHVGAAIGFPLVRRRSTTRPMRRKRPYETGPMRSTTS